MATFGIREFHFDAATGFWLNGRNFKLKGVGLHSDGGAVGTAVPLRVWERRLKQLRLIGVNAIRTAHNPPAPEFLDLCDRMGFLVMDEMFDCWTVAKNRYDYHLYFRRMVAHRHRATPSAATAIIPASSCIAPATKSTTPPTRRTGARNSRTAWSRSSTPTIPPAPSPRPSSVPTSATITTTAWPTCSTWSARTIAKTKSSPPTKPSPTRKIVGTETTHDRRAWLALRDNPPFAGQFLWAGIDYLGEAPGWPAVASYSGLLDKTGAIKPIGWERASWWSDKPMVHMVRRVAPRQASAVDPGYEGRRPIPAETLVRRLDALPIPRPTRKTSRSYSNCAQVELLLNGKSLGSEPLRADASARTWHVTFEPGTLRAACAAEASKPGPSYELRTAGKPVKIVLSADRNPLTPGWDEVSYVTATVTDENGATVPSATPAIAFKVEGPGAIAAVDSADNTSHEPFQATERRAFHGWCVALVRMRRAGRLIVTASAEGLTSEPIAIEGR